MHNYCIKKAFSYMTYHILPSLFWLCVIFGFDTPYIAVLTVLTALLHELGHMLAAFYINSNVSLPIGHITGFRIKRRGITSYKNEIIILAGGPIANLLCVFWTLPFLNLFKGYVFIFIAINLSTALSNLLPSEGYDGYGILFQIFESRGISTRYLDTTSFIISIVLTFFSLYLIGKFGEGYWIFGMFFVSLSGRIRKMIKYDVF